MREVHTSDFILDNSSPKIRRPGPHAKLEFMTKVSSNSQTLFGQPASHTPKRNPLLWELLRAINARKRLMIETLSAQIRTDGVDAHLESAPRDIVKLMQIAPTDLLPAHPIQFAIWSAKQNPPRDLEGYGYLYVLIQRHKLLNTLTGSTNSEQEIRDFARSLDSTLASLVDFALDNDEAPDADRLAAPAA